MGGTFDVIVIGVGGMGSAALFELARRGRRVLGLEQFGLGHDQGSSHGLTRIIRKAYYEHPDYVPLVQRAYERWYDLEQRQGLHLLTGSPCLSIGRKDSKLIQGVKASADQHKLPIDSFGNSELRKRFPAFRVGDEYVGVLERSAGFLYVEQCVLAYAREAQRLGAEVHDHEAVVRWEASPTVVTVETKKGRYSAARLVLTAGPWAGAFLTSCDVPLTVMRQVALWFQPHSPGLFRRDVFPLYIVDSPIGHFYGFPMLDPSGIKMAQHYGAPELAGPESIERTVTPEDEENGRRFLRDFLPDGNGPLRRSSVCIYTLTPDRHFVIDLHPEHANVAVAAGFSGHGFKFASVVGDVLADLAEAGRTQLPISMFRIDRFA